MKICGAQVFIAPTIDHYPVSGNKAYVSFIGIRKHNTKMVLNMIVESDESYGVYFSINDHL